MLLFCAAEVVHNYVLYPDGLLSKVIISLYVALTLCVHVYNYVYHFVSMQSNVKASHTVACILHV